MKIELRDIITRSELVTWKEMSAFGDDASAYESMIARWQKDLNAALAKQDKERAQRVEAYANSIALVTKWGIGIVLAAAILWGGTAVISGLVASNRAAHAAEYNKNIESGLFPFGVRTGNSQIKDAPAGVTLAAMEAEDTSGAFSSSSVLRYTLNLPMLPDTQVYAVAHELIDDGKVVGTGLFYTNPREHGLSRFEKKVDSAARGQEFDWLKITVRVVDAGSVPKKE
jgi:hypothetical protein